LSICGEWRLCPALQSSDETLILQAQRMAGSTGRSAARQKAGEWPVRAVHVVRGEIVWQDRCDAANGSKEP